LYGLLRLYTAFHFLDGWNRIRGKSPSDLYFLGIGRSFFLPFNRILAYKTTTGLGCAKSVYSESNWRCSIFIGHPSPDLLHGDRRTFRIENVHRNDRTLDVNGHRPLAVWGLRGQIGSISPIRLATRCDGGPHACFSFDPCGNHGGSRYFSHGPNRLFTYAHSRDRHSGRWAYHYGGWCPKSMFGLGYYESSSLFHPIAIRAHGGRNWLGRLALGLIPSVHPRIFQSWTVLVGWVRNPRNVSQIQYRF